jgi:hypothetical protein
VPADSNEDAAPVPLSWTREQLLAILRGKVALLEEARTSLLLHKATSPVEGDPTKLSCTEIDHVITHMINRVIQGEL